ncbi:hypothetical protein J6A32_06140 [Methanocorpusculum sp.]|nr:hypothetical protein [Methanocorpusculum sp.]MBO5431793.1 hypothetical protein [Methanocorpusculum sp.]
MEEKRSLLFGLFSDSGFTEERIAGALLVNHGMFVPKITDAALEEGGALCLCPYLEKKNV